jgi:hypothetical protein
MVNFQTKNLNLDIFYGPLNGKCWYILYIFGIFLVHLEHFREICYFCGHLVYFTPFGYIAIRKSWQP